MKTRDRSLFSRWSFLAVSVLAVLGGAGCQRYVELQNTGDRIWMISKDQTEVFRCWDLKNQTGKLIAVCRHAQMLGTNEGSKLADLAEQTAAPAHPDSTEVVPAQPTMIAPTAHR